MPSPFPGMDPYLEQSDWVSVHVHLGVEIARYLSPLVRPKYIVRAAKVSLPMPHSIPQITVEIRDVEERSLVTAIEILSLTNKRGDGREEYLAKRNRMLASGTHLIELDLLREGQRMPTMTPLPDAPYFVLLSRVEKRPVADVWPISLRSSLPKIPIPLSDGDADVELDLQAVLSTLYDTYAYDVEIKYDNSLILPLSADDAAWAAERIESWKTGRS